MPDSMDSHRTTAANPNRHPLALLPVGTTGVGGLMSADSIVCTTCHRHGWADEFLPDGDALVTFDGGEHARVKWIELITELPVAASA